MYASSMVAQKMNAITYICIFTWVITTPTSSGPMQTFEIDGNYYVDNTGTNIDWITVVDGCRMGVWDTSGSCSSLDCGLIDGIWESCQSQCLKDQATDSQFWSSGIFCDTYGMSEQSLLAASDFFDTESWVPLAVQSAGPAKGDLTNIFYAGSNVDMIMCLAMERINPQGDSYVDFEFVQREYRIDPCTEPKTNDGASLINTEYDWKCHTTNRTIDDIQISFIMKSQTSGFTILFCRWRPDYGNAPTYDKQDPSWDIDKNFYKSTYWTQNNMGTPPDWLPDVLISPDTGTAPHCGANGLAATSWWVFGWVSFDGTTYTASSTTFQDAVDGAVNLGEYYNDGQKQYEKASPFGHMDHQKAPDAGNTATYPNWEYMEAGTFMEACINWQMIGFNSMCYDGMIVKTKASDTGAPKDTGGFMRLEICGNINMTFSPTPPSHNPTMVPTTGMPTSSTSNPTTNEPTSTTGNPTIAPSITTGNPTTNEPTTIQPTQQTSSPSGETSAPTQQTPQPTTQTRAPTGETYSPTPGPTVIKGSPSRAPTKRPSPGPTPGPTVPKGSPSRAPTIRPSINPSGYPTTKPSASPTPDSGCTGDDSFDRTECYEPPLSGCYLQFNITANVCILNNKFGRSDIFKDFKDTIIYLIEGTPRFEGLCNGTKNVRVEFYGINYADQIAINNGQLNPGNSNECNECSVDDDQFKYSITAHINFYCGDCHILKDILDDFKENAESWGRQAPTQLVAYSKKEDSICKNGFGKATLVYFSGVYKSDEGVSGDCVGDCDISDGGDEGSDEGEDNTDMGCKKEYVCTIGYVLCLIVLCFSFY